MSIIYDEVCQRQIDTDYEADHQHEPEQEDEAEPCWNCGEPSTLTTNGAAFCSRTCAEEFQERDYADGR